MPQLNPSPWFMIFLLAWLTFILLITKTLMTRLTPPIMQPNQELNNKNWTWPWP